MCIATTKQEAGIIIVSVDGDSNGNGDDKTMLSPCAGVYVCVCVCVCVSVYIPVVEQCDAEGIEHHTIFVTLVCSEPL
jgi:hypothetical protein